MRKTSPWACIGAFAVIAELAATTACGGEPPPKEPEAAHVEPPKPSKPAFKMKSELGSVDPGAVKQAFGALNDKFTDCQKQGLDRVEVLAGGVKFFLRIGPDGSARYAYLEESDVGDRGTEKCMLNAVMGARWPKPEDGEAEARYGMELPLQSSRGPNDWSADKVAHALGKHGEALDRCKAGATASFRATMYIGPGGRVLAAGVATSNKDGEDKSDCLAGVLVKLKGLPSPGSWPAKVSFGL